MKHKLLLLVLLVASVITNSSAQWTQIGSHVSNATDTVSASLTHNNIVGFGNAVYCCTDSGLFVSNNNGDTWQNMTDDIAVVDNEKIYSFLVASNNDMFLGSTRRLFKSVNNGTSWSWLTGTLPDSLTYNGIAEINGNIVVSYNKNTNGGAYYSGNGGDTWTQSSGLPDLAMRQMEKVVDTLYLAGKDGVYKSIDNGQSWFLSGTGYPLNSRYFQVISSQGSLFAGDVNGNGMWASYDNGDTWINPQPALFTGFCQVMSFTESGTMVLSAMSGSTCSGSGESIKMSNDNGQTWNTFMTGLTSGYYPILGKNSDGSSFFTKGSPGGKKVFRYDLVTGIQTTVKNDSKVIVSPNPFSDYTEITIEGFSNLPYNFVVYDISGKEVIQRMINSKTFRLETSGFTDGIYFYRLSESGNTVATGKLIIQ